MKTFKKALIVLVLFLVILGVIGLFLPSVWSVQRSITVNAPASKVFPYINNFKTGWPQWSAFDSMGGAVYTYSGPEEGIGASRSWVSKQGDGQQTMTKSDENTGIEYEIAMANGVNITGTLALSSEGDTTTITFTDMGNNGGNIVHKYLSLVIQKMIGKTMDTSLQNLKQLAEAPTPE
ncbi:MAG: SRPBCC family protein [Candidatus Margulisiibacteriota bacterium]